MSDAQIIVYTKSRSGVLQLLIWLMLIDWKLKYANVRIQRVAHFNPNHGGPKMKTLFSIRMMAFLAVSFGALRTSAQFVFLDDNRAIDARGGTNGVQVYAQTNFPSTPFAPFDARANGRANDDGGYITSSAYQASSLFSNAIYVTNGVFVAYDYSHLPPSEYGTAIATGRFQISFTVQTPTVCSLTGVEAINGLVNPAYASLTSAHHGTITTAPMMSAPWKFLGVLQPDTYVLDADLGMNWYASRFTGFGGIDSAGVTTQIALIAEPPPQMMLPSANSNMFRFTVLTAPGSTNRVWARTNLASSVSPWRSISTNVADTNGIFQFADIIAPGQTANFYEVSCP